LPKSVLGAVEMASERELTVPLEGDESKAVTRDTVNQVDSAGIPEVASKRQSLSDLFTIVSVTLIYRAIHARISFNPPRLLVN
jgi:hypothetical protein